MKKRLRNVLLTTLILALVSTQTLVRAEEPLTNKGTPEQQEVIQETKNDVKEESKEKLMAPAASANVTTDLTFGNDKQDVYMGGDTLTVWSQIIVSSTGSDVVKEDSYFKIYIPKANVKSMKPDAVTIDAAYYKSAKVEETATDWVVVFTTKSLAGGTNVSLPVVIKLTPDNVVNNSIITINQELYDNNNTLMSSDKLDIKGKAYLENYEASNKSNDMTEKVVNDKIPAGTDSKFSVSILSGREPIYNHTDPRDRRVYATIPSGYQVVNDGKGAWIKEGSTGRYYRDFKRDELVQVGSTSQTGVTLDVSGIDLKNHTQANPVNIKVDYEVVVMKNGVAQNDLGPARVTVTNTFFVTSSIVNDKWIGSTDGYLNFMDKNNNYINSRLPFQQNDLGYGQIAMKFADVENENLKLRITHKNLSGIKNEGDNSVGADSAVLIKSTIDVPNFVVTDGFRVNYFGNLSESQRNLLNSRIKGTKVYGVNGGNRTLLAEIQEINVGSSLEGTYNSQGWVKATENKFFSQIEFVYPGNGLELNTSDGSMDLLANIHTDASFNITESSIKELTDLFYSDTATPEMRYKPNVKIEAKAAGNTGIEDHFFAEKTLMAIVMLEHAKVSFGEMVKAYGDNYKNTVFPGEIVTLRSSVTATSVGEVGYESQTKNGTMYFLIPEGFDVITEGNESFANIKTLKNYINGKTLVIAKPKKELHPISTGVGRPSYDQQEYFLKLRVNNRTKETEYKFKGAYIYDNNKLTVVDGKQDGLKPNNSFKDGEWLDVIKNAENRPINPKQYIDLREGSITVKPPKVFSSYNDVRVTDKSNSSFASSTGRDATRGSKIDYQWSLVNDSPADIKSLEVVNVLPYPGDVAIVPNSDGSHTERGSQFKTPLLSPLSSDIFDFYYSTDKPVRDVSNLPSVNWVSSVQDYSQVTMIKAVLKSGKTLKLNDTAKIVSSHQIPNDPNIKDNDFAYNNFAVTFNGGTTYMDAPGAEAKIYLERADVIIDKVDENNHNLKLAGAKFDVYDSKDRLVFSNLETDSKGNLTLPSLAVGGEYYLVETQAPTGYVVRDGKIPFTVAKGTNTLQVTNSKDEKTSVTVTKSWAGGPDIHPTIKVQLYQNGNPLGAPVELVNGTNSYTWSDLKVKDANGTKYTYTVDEISNNSDYQKQVDGYHITNTFVENTNIDITGTKTWNDSSNKEGLRPTDITVRLHADGKKLDLEPTWVKNGNTWTYTFAGVPEKENGKVISYTITEDAVANYTSEVTGKNITNSREVAKRVVTGTKTWMDNDDRDGLRPDTVNVLLYANGTQIAATPTWRVDSKNVWTYTFANLDTYANGEAITYTVDEETVPNYTKDVVGYNITNTHAAETTTVSGTKVWNDNKNQDGIRPSTVTVKLFGNGNEVKATPIWTNTDKDTWNYSYPQLPKFENGTAITYTVDEVSVKDYETSISGYTITNTHTPTTINVEGTKTWVDNDNQDGIRPTDITITLHKNGEAVIATPEWTKNGDVWSYVFSNQPEFANGTKINYTVTEETVAGYTTDINDLDITNTHEIDTTVVTGTKTWNDASNAAGFRPETITVKLHANGTELPNVPTWTKGENTWTYTFSNVAVKENGTDIIYTVTEDKVENYTTVITDHDITNTHTPSTINVEGTKTWVDNDNQDGIRPTDITITLHKNGEAVIATPEWTKNGDVWSYVFKNQPEFANGTKINYTVTEETVTGYTADINGLDITNTHDIDTTVVTGTKTWNDASNAAGFRPETITVKLHANGTELPNIPTWTKSENTWTYEFANLDTKESGTDITYTVTEDKVANYTTDITGYDITNTHTPTTINVEGTKTWVDNDNQDGIRPTDITITLHKNGEAVIATPEWTKNGDVWSYVFNDQPEFANGQKINYTVTEETVTGYTADINDLDITNTHEIDTKVVTGTKTWNDASNAAGFRPETITVKLHANGTELPNIPTWTKSENTWTYEFANLDTKAEGTDITYTVTEDKVENYTTVITGYDITNTHTPTTINVEGTKTWNDKSDQDGKRPDEIVVKLYSNDEKVNVEPVWTKNGDTWNYIFENQPEYKNGKKVVYTITEDDVPGYTQKIVDFNITNSRATEVRTITGTKVWNDNDNQDGIRPTDIIVKLIANGQKLEVKPEWIKNGNTWSYKFSNLPKYANKLEINYSIEELTVNGYTAKITDFNLVNTHEVSMINIEGSKVWNDNSNQDGIRPDEVIVKLYANGDLVEAIPTWTQNGNTWNYVFENQPEFKAGTKITYTVDETAVEGYEKHIDEFTITNTHKPEMTEIEGQKIWSDASNQDGIRPTDITITLHKNGEALNLTPEWVKSENEWHYTFGELPVFENGEKLVYTITEESVNGYESVIDNFNITNTHKVSTIDLTGQKVWIDNSNKENVRPNEIVVNLYANGEKLTVTPEWTKDNDVWTYVFKTLPEYQNGKKIVYTVDENPVDNYESSVDGFTITNTVKESIVDPEKPKPILPTTGVAPDSTLTLLGIASLVGGLTLKSRGGKKKNQEDEE
ncbi:MAG: Cna B-type domain-containing protein [Erysipelothrix sp.]